MKKLLKSGIYGSVNSALIHCSLWKSQHLWKFNICGYYSMNSSRITPKRVEKKKKNQNVKITNADAAKAQSERALYLR